jgi:hypothetical protein
LDQTAHPGTPNEISNYAATGMQYKVLCLYGLSLENESPKQSGARNREPASEGGQYLLAIF